MKIGIVGLGFVGGAMYKSFMMKGIDVVGYDKFKDDGVKSITELFKCDIVFLCLPTLFSEEKCEYDKSALEEVLECFEENEYDGVVVLKSTVEPETTNAFSKMYKKLRISYNPEFLTARTAFKDFHNQTHVVLGKGLNSTEKDMKQLEELYKTYYPNIIVSHCTSLESESMKIMCNTYYSIKIMAFNEFYLMCKNNGSNYETIKSLMIKNGWVNPMHTDVPGPDGLIGYGGACFPKDTKALNKYMERLGTPHGVLENAIKENNNIRNKNDSTKILI